MIASAQSTKAWEGTRRTTIGDVTDEKPFYELSYSFGQEGRLVRHIFYCKLVREVPKSAYMRRT